MRFSDGAGVVATLNGLTVQGDRVTNAGATPTWAREDTVKDWALGTYTYKATVDYGALTLTSPALKLVSIVGDLGDPGLQTPSEIDDIMSVVEKVPGFMAVAATFDKDATLAAWENGIGNAYVYHHISHGNLRCADHPPHRVYAGNDRRVVPAYPWGCASEDHAAKDLAWDQAMDTAVLAEKLPGFKALVEQLIVPTDAQHRMTGAFQWVGPGDSSTDVMMGVAELTAAARWPTCLAFLNSCMLGWEKSLPRLFIAKGTPYVIAFRCRVVGGDGLAFAKAFYAEWGKQSLAPGAVEAAFKATSKDFPRAEPVLFTAAKIVAASAPARCAASPRR